MRIKKQFVYGISSLAVGVTLMACGGGDSNSTKTTSQTPTGNTASPTAASQSSAKPASDLGASVLRSTLTSLLEEHVYLAANTTGVALNGGDFKPAAAALDANSVALSKAIGSVYGPGAESAFLELWRKHIGFFVDYTMGAATKDAAKMTKAKADLDGYRADFGAFLASANPNLTKDAVATELTPHVATLIAAIDAQAAKSPQTYTLLRTAASHMPHTAEVLSTAIVKQYPDKFPGKADGSAATLRAGLTSLLEEHVYLASMATGTALSGGDPTMALAGLDANSVDLSKAIGSVYGPGAEKAFLELWRKHIGFFVDYTTGVATKDSAKMTKAKTDLDGYRADFGAFLASANPNLPKDAVATELTPHVATLIAVIDSQGAKADKQWTDLRTAASHMPHTAEVLASAISKQMPDKFVAADFQPSGTMLTASATTGGMAGHDHN